MTMKPDPLLLDRLIPTAVRENPDQLWRARLGMVMGLVSALGCLVAVALRLAVGQTDNTNYLLGAVLFAALPHGFRFYGSLRLWANISAAVGLLVLASIITRTGGAGTAALYAVLFVPTVPALIGRLRDGLWWALLCSVGFVSLWWAHRIGVPFQPFDPATSVTIQILGAGVIMWLGVAAMAAYAHQRDRAAEAMEAGSKAKSTFLANISHEIRTPMNAVLGALDLLEDSSLTQRDQDLLSTAQRSARHLLTLLDDLIDIARVESDSFDLQSVPVDLHAVAQQVIQLFEPRAQARGVELELDWSTATPHGVRTDPTRLRQILMNLVSNALSFTPEGRVTLRVRGAAATIDWPWSTPGRASGPSSCRRSSTPSPRPTPRPPGPTKALAWGSSSASVWRG